MLITLEGIEGAGKSTVAAALVRELTNAGVPLTAVRDPGDTDLGNAVRDLLLHTQQAIDPMAELLLFWSARRQLIAERMLPALARGEVVLADRFFDSTTAYQGHGRGLPMDVIEWLRANLCRDCRPDLTLLLDVDPALGLRRAATKGAPDRMEGEGQAFLERVREGFLTIARQEPERVRVIANHGDMDATLGAARAALAPALLQANLPLPQGWPREVCP